MPRYQIEFRTTTSAAYVYFDADEFENAGDKACEIAEQKAQNENEPCSKAFVREYDPLAGKPVSKGRRFTCHLRKLKAVLSTGVIIQEQYYQSLYR